MSYAASYEPQMLDYESEAVVVDDSAVKRSIFLPLPFLIPTAICGVSWLAGGMGLLTDAGFLLLTVFCGMFLLLEILRFPRRYGIGGMVLFGGTLIWFCHDYFT